MPENESTTALVEETAEVASAAAEKVSARASRLADWVTDWIDGFAWMPEGLVGWAVNGILLAGLFLISWVIFAGLRPLILRWVRSYVDRTENRFDDQIFGHGIFRWLTHLIPAVLIFLISPGLFSDTPGLALIMRKLATLYLLVAAFLVLDSAINAARSILQDTKFAERINLAIVSQVLKLVLVLVLIILLISTIIGQSPLVLLGGLGVIASVLMLIFKDVILGLVAGIQLSGNEMLSVGDWLEMPSHHADGNVEEIGLTTVKVRNFDNTITTVPTYALISTPFKNWRGMQESGGRRIKRSLLVDTNSIRLCDERMLERFEKIDHIASYIEEKQRVIAEHNAQIPTDRAQIRVNGRRLTNVGTFRAYIVGYLRNHPEINQDLTLLVRQLAPVGQGLPIEIYCFSANKAWVAYEAIQADIFDHLIAVAPEFGLRVFQQPSGSDFHDAFEASRGEGRS